MKKLITVLLMLMVCITSFGQGPVPIKEYQIDTVGRSNGLEIPEPFRIQVQAMYVSGGDSTGWIMECQTITYPDSTYSVQIVNDSIPVNCKFKVPCNYIDSTNSATVNNFIKGRLDEVYGSNNVIEKN